MRRPIPDETLHQNSRTQPPKCFNCGEAHTVNYRKCPVYVAETHSQGTAPHPPNTINPPSTISTEAFSYVLVAKKSVVSQQGSSSYPETIRKSLVKILQDTISNISNSADLSSGPSLWRSLQWKMSSNMSDLLCIIYGNCQGISRKRSELQQLVIKLKPDIILLNETHLNPGKKFNIPNFITYRSNRQTSGFTNYGGTAILIRRNITHSSIKIDTLSIEKSIIHTSLNG